MPSQVKQCQVKSFQVKHVRVVPPGILFSPSILSNALGGCSHQQEVAETAPDGITLDEFIDKFGPLLGNNLSRLEVRVPVR